MDITCLVSFIPKNGFANSLQIVEQVSLFFANNRPLLEFILIDVAVCPRKKKCKPRSMSHDVEGADPEHMEMKDMFGPVDPDAKYKPLPAHHQNVSTRVLFYYSSGA